jgi:hypothetical protein
MPKSLATLEKELAEFKQKLVNSTVWPPPRDAPKYSHYLSAYDLRPLIAKTEKEIENLKKKEIEKKEARIAALNSTTLGQKLPEDVIRKVSEYGGRKRKTRKGKKSNKRKTYRK